MKKINRNKEGFSIGALLSQAEVDLARATSRRKNIEIDKAVFEEEKNKYRKIEIADESFVDNYISRAESIVVKGKEEVVKEEEVEEGETE